VTAAAATTTTQRAIKETALWHCIATEVGWKRQVVVKSIRIYLKTTLKVRNYR